MENYIVYHPEKGYLSANDKFRKNINFAYQFTHQKAIKKASHEGGQVRQIFSPDPKNYHSHIFDKDRGTETPTSLPTVIIPDGFIDQSFINDTCPCMYSELLDVVIWVDYNNPNHRDDFFNGNQFGITGNSVQEETILSSDSYDRILSEVEKLRKYTKIANHFSTALRETLTKDQMQKVVTRNRKEPHKNRGVCHSHDFCDANMVMDEAFRKFGIDEIDIQSNEHIYLWNKAWDRAKIHDFKQIGEKQK